MTPFERLNKFAGKYEFNFQMWGEGKYSIYVSKDGVDLWSCGGEETAEDAIKKTLNYLKSIKATITKRSKSWKYTTKEQNTI